MRLHFMGIGGSGISGVARLAEKMGYVVTGCDLEENTAYADNIFKGHDVEHIKNADLVIISPAILFQDPDNPELVQAQKKGIAITWQEFLGKYLSKGKKVICIAGTHGKSTTTAMAGKLLIDAGLDPLVVLGANVPAWGGNSRFGKGEYFIIEADEFNNNFLNYHPEIAIINNIEFDHPDFFKNEEDVKDAFDKFVKNLTGEKILITQKDNLNKKFKLKVLGEHNQKNANMVFLLGKKLGIDEEIIIKSLEEFSGIERRLELVSGSTGVKVYDDYAHHPTAIQTTLEGLKGSGLKGKMWVVVEPHGYKRTEALLSKYQNVFAEADEVLIGPIFPARDIEKKEINPQLVAKASGHKNARGFTSFEEIKEFLKKKVRPEDTVVVMGAGKSYLWAREIAKILKEDENGSVKIEDNKSFRDLTTFRIGGHIKYYIEVSNAKEIDEAVCFAKKKDLPIFVIGGGSDVLIADNDFNGVAIKFIGTEIKAEGETVKAEAGVEWDDLAAYSVELNLQGIECLSGIPGSTGAAPIQNIGAYGQELKNTFVSLTAYDIDKEKFVELNNEDCKFGYRESIFKRPDHWQKFIITDITLKLNKGVKPEVKYDSLKNYLKEKGIIDPTLSQVRDAVITVRAGKFENPKIVGNAGSFFKNPIINSVTAERLLKEYPEMPARPQEEGGYKGSAAWLIEQAGWKGKTYKSAGVSPKHALVLINPKGDAKAIDLIELSDKIIEDVMDKFGVRLEREVQLINL